MLSLICSKVKAGSSDSGSHSSSSPSGRSLNVTGTSRLNLILAAVVFNPPALAPAGPEDDDLENDRERESNRVGMLTAVSSTQTVMCIQCCERIHV